MLLLNLAGNLIKGLSNVLMKVTKTVRAENWNTSPQLVIILPSSMFFQLHVRMKTFHLYEKSNH